MRTLMVINPNKKQDVSFEELGTVQFGNVNVLLGAVDLSCPVFDTNDSKNDEYVLVQVTAFSCNYRDKAILLDHYQRFQNSNRLFFPFGSEFCATVINLGKEVKEFNIGDRVMSDCAYPESGAEGVVPGVATNFASLGWLRFHKKKLVKVPQGLSDCEAASFSLGSQTALSMIKRSGILESGGQPLVFSARSATSLFIIQYLIAFGFKPICLSTSKWSDAEKQCISPGRLESMNDEHLNFSENEVTHVFDPFCDMNIGSAMYHLQIGGTYVTCGIRDQHPLLSKEPLDKVEPTFRGAVELSIVKNISILGNCLGTKEDLKQAIDLQERAKLKPILDRQYSLNQGADFVQRSFFDFNRLGKCVIMYES